MVFCHYDNGWVSVTRELRRKRIQRKTKHASQYHPLLTPSFTTGIRKKEFGTLLHNYMVTVKIYSLFIMLCICLIICHRTIYTFDPTRSSTDKKKLYSNENKCQIFIFDRDQLIICQVIALSNFRWKLQISSQKQYSFHAYWSLGNEQNRLKFVNIVSTEFKSRDNSVGSILSFFYFQILSFTH